MKNRVNFAAAIAILLVAIAVVATVGLDLTAGASQEETVPRLLAEYESGDRQFTEVQIGEKIVYYHQRMIGNATVEKDFVVYHFDKNSEQLIARKIHWREDLPEQLPQTMIAKEEAELLIEGEVQFSRLCYISPESDVYPIEPTPENPCWIVRSINDGNLMVTLVDAVSGRILGNGVPPPFTAFSMSGPCYFEPCDWSWDSWYQNAEYWFETMGYSTEALLWPNHSQIQQHIESDQIALIYEIAHSGSLSTRFASGCIDGNLQQYTYASDIEAWITGYPKVPFTFMASCYSMCDTSYGNLSHAFRKGSTEKTVTVGYCDMSLDKCWDCWTYSLDFQDMMFSYMNEGKSVKEAFDLASATYSTCAGNGCILFAGDDDLAVIPIVFRQSPLCGDADGSGEIDIDDVVYLIAYIFSGGPPPTPHYCVGNANGSVDGFPVDIDDVVYLISYIFTGGPAPATDCCEF